MSPLFRNKGRDEAEAALKSADDTLSILESGEADLGPAQRLRDRAEGLVRRGAYREAVDAARKAEETAKLVDRLHTAASQGIARLRTERSRMAKLGMAVEDVDPLVAAGESWMTKTLARDGDPQFPAYSKAGEFALRGLKLAKERVPKFKSAAAAVYDSEQALRAMIASNRFVERSAFEFFVLKPATDVLKEAKGKLRANAFEEAENLAQQTLAMAKQIDETYGRVTDAFTKVDEGLRAFRSEGGVTADAEALLTVCRTALEHGKFEEAAEVAGKAGTLLGEVRAAYRSLVLKLRTAEDAIGEAERWGFDVQEPRAILSEARHLMEAGRYEEAGPRLDAARAAALGVRETHRATASRIVAMRQRIAGIRPMNAAVAAEAEVMLSKAETLLEEGRYGACEEDLQIASLLLVDVEAASRTPAGPAPGLASLLQAARAVGPSCPTCGGPLADDGTCPTCTVLPEPENPEVGSPIARAVEGARRVLAEIGQGTRTLAERVAANVQACAMCGGPLAGEDVLCAKCQATVKGRV